MVDRPVEVCAFCKQGDDAGSLRNTTDRNILAHYNCLLFSPKVVSRPMKDSQDLMNEFDIESVKQEINRGKKTTCSYCGKKGGTIGCDIRRCKKTYHYLCVKKDNGVYKRDEENEIYVIYCKKHANDKHQAEQVNGTPKSSHSLSGSHRNSILKKRKPKRIRTLSGSRQLKHISDHGILNAEKENKLHWDRNRLFANQINDEDMEVKDTSTSSAHQKSRSESENEVESTDCSPARKYLFISDESEYNTSAGEMKKHGTSFKRLFSDSSKSESDWSPTNHHVAEAGWDNPIEGPSNALTSVVIGRNVGDELSGPSTTQEKKIPNNIIGGELENKTISTELNKTLHSTTCENSSSCSSDSCSILDPKIKCALSLSGFPKENKKRTKKKHNPELDKALLNMEPDEKKAYYTVYDEVGGSLSMSQDWLPTHSDNNGETTDIEDVEIYVPSSTVLVTTPETQSANCAGETSSSKFGTPYAEKTETASAQSETTDKGMSTKNLVLHLGDHCYCINGEIVSSTQLVDSSSEIARSLSPISQPVDKSNGKHRSTTQSQDSINSNVSLDIQHTVSSNSKCRLSSQPVYSDNDKHRTAKELFDIFARFIKDHKNIILDRSTSANASKTFNENSINLKLSNNTCVEACQISCKQPVLSSSVPGSVEVHATKKWPIARTLDFSTHRPSITNSLNEQPTSTNKILNEQTESTQCLTRKFNEHMDCQNTSKMSDEQPKLLQNSSKPKNFSEEMTAQEHRSEAHSSLSSTENGSIISNFILTENNVGSPKARNTSLEKGTPTSNTEPLPASSSSCDVLGATSSLHEKERHYSPYLSHKQLKDISTNLRNGSFSRTFSSMVPQIQSTIESAKKTRPQRDDAGISAGQSKSNMSSKLTKTHSNHLEANQTSTETAAPILQTASTVTQTEISAGFPLKMGVSLNTEQKSQLLQCYERITEQRETCDVMNAGAAQAFWNLCLENKCREHLLTMLENRTESVINKIIHGEPDDRDYECAFEFLQASGCFEDFIKGDESQTKSNSSKSKEEPFNESNPSLASSPSILGNHSLASSPSILGNHAELACQEEEVINNEHNMMQPELPKISSSSVRVVEGSRRNKNHDQMEMCSPGTSSTSCSTSSRVKEIQSQTHAINSEISQVQVSISKMLQDLNAHLLQRLHEDGDAALANVLMYFFRKVPEDKKLPTMIALLSALHNNLE